MQDFFSANLRLVALAKGIASRCMIKLIAASTLFSTPLSASREDSVSFSPVRQSLTQTEINLEGFCAWLHAGFKVDQPRHHVPHGSENLFSKSNKPALKEKSKHPRDQTSSD